MLVMQVGAGVTAAANHQWYRALYWLGALVLTFAAVRGLNR
jgi:threonine/homoserine/homoserine lactone efflux protein